MPSWVTNLFACWKAIGGRFQLDVIWKMVLFCLMWCLWRERNDQSFKDRERTVVELKALLFKTLFHWAAAFDSNITYFHFLDLFFYY